MPVNFEFKRLFLLTTGFCSTYNNIEGQVKGEIGKNDHVPFFFFRVLSIYPISNKRQKSTSIFFLPHFFSILRGQNNSFLLKRNVLNSERERERKHQKGRKRFMSSKPEIEWLRTRSGNGSLHATQESGKKTFLTFIRGTIFQTHSFRFLGGVNLFLRNAMQRRKPLF